MNVILPSTVAIKRHYKSSKKGFIFLATFLCLQFLCSYSNTVNAAQNAISIIYSGEKPYTRKVIDHLYQSLDSLPISINTINVEHESLKKSPLKNSKLLISLGTQVSQQVLTLNLKRPILSLLIPSQAYSSLKKYHSDNTPWKIVFIDQPLTRQMHLIQAIFGNNKNIATILGPYSKSIKHKLKNIAKRNKQKINIDIINNSKQLTRSLRPLLQSADILLAIPDPMTFNKRNIRSILLMSYHQGVPMIGFSRPYVKAGAIAAIFSEAKQISTHATNIINNFLNNKRFKTSTEYSQDFSIALNKNVARTLNIYLPSEDIIHQKIKRMEK